MSDQNSAVAVYGTHEGAEQGVKEFQRAGVDMQTVSILGKETHTDEQSVTGAGLVGIGIPKDSVIEYELALKTDKYLLMVNGSETEINKARGIVESTHPLTTALHSFEAVGSRAR